MSAARANLYKGGLVRGRGGGSMLRANRQRRATSAGRARLQAARDATRSRGAVARAARAMMNTRTAGFLGIETKFYDTNLNLTGISTATDCSGAELDPSATSMISTPAVGDGEQNRDGKRIVIKSVQLAGTLRGAPQANQTAVDDQPIVFVALVLDTQTNGAQLNSEDVYKNLNNQTATLAKPLRNLLFAQRFKVLKSASFQMPAPTVTYDGTNIEQGGTQVNFEWFLPMELPVNFNAGTTSSVANVIDNSLHVIAFVTSPDVAVSLAYNARIRFQG